MKLVYYLEGANQPAEITLTGLLWWEKLSGSWTFVLTPKSKTKFCHALFQNQLNGTKKTEISHFWYGTPQSTRNITHTDSKKYVLLDFQTNIVSKGTSKKNSCTRVKGIQVVRHFFGTHPVVYYATQKDMWSLSQCMWLLLHAILHTQKAQIKKKVWNSH
jgi:hypothetical protein